MHMAYQRKNSAKFGNDTPNNNGRVVEWQGKSPLAANI